MPDFANQKLLKMKRNQFPIQFKPNLNLPGGTPFTMFWFQRNLFRELKERTRWMNKHKHIKQTKIIYYTDTKMM
jgi:hypothetical protein